MHVCKSARASACVSMLHACAMSLAIVNMCSVCTGYRHPADAGSAVGARHVVPGVRGGLPVHRGQLEACRHEGEWASGSGGRHAYRHGGRATGAAGLEQHSSSTYVIPFFFLTKQSSLLPLLATTYMALHVSLHASFHLSMCCMSEKSNVCELTNATCVWHAWKRATVCISRTCAFVLECGLVYVVCMFF